MFRNKNRRAIWECECDCGNIIITNSRALISGSKTSCGCAIEDYKNNKLKNNNLTGKRFGALIVLERMPERINDH